MTDQQPQQPSAPVGENGSDLDSDPLWLFYSGVDADESGNISAGELQKALGNGTWYPFNLETVHLMIGMFDRDISGTINFNEFQALWRYVSEWYNAFRCYDQDNSGSIDANELRKTLTDIGYRLSNESYSALIVRFDRYGSGKMGFDDFIQCCAVLHNFTNSFREYDTNRNGSIHISYEQYLRLAFGLKS